MIEIKQGKRVSHSFIGEAFTVPTSKPFKLWIAIINFWIYVSCISLALETLEPFATTYKSLFSQIELIAVAFFVCDYVGNVFYAEHRVKYIFSIWGLVDLISILPTFLVMLDLGALQGAKVLRVLRVVRVLRVLKMAKIALQELSNKVKSSNPLITNLRIYFIALFSVIMISSSLMFFVEGDLYSAENMAIGQAALDAELKINPLPPGAPPEAAVFAPIDPIGGNAIPADKHFFTSIPSTMWWCIVTLTTTGYGDMFPVTFGGRVIASFTMFFGLILFGILMNIVGKTLMVLLFGESMQENQDSKNSKEHAISMLLSLKLLDPEKGAKLLTMDDEQIKEKLKNL
jgi:voltage-gated potassium channel